MFEPYRRILLLPASSILLVLLFVSAFPSVVDAPETTQSSSRGPKSDLVINFYPNVSMAFSALKHGEVDVVAESITRGLYSIATDDRNVVLAPVSDTGFFEFDLNNNYTLQEFPSYTNPMSYVEMRRAVAWLTDKNYIVNVYCGGFAERIDQMIAAPLKGWRNESMWYPNYPYEYDPNAAKTVLDSMFPEGATANPYYDPSFPGSAQSIRTYPAGHEKEGQDLDPMIFVVRTDDTRRLRAGILIIDNMRKIGVPINEYVNTKAAVYDRVMGLFNYHLFTGGWDVGYIPPLSLYGLYHSSFYFPYGQNYLTGIAQGVPKYPYLDYLLERAAYPDNFSDALKYTKLAVGYMTTECINVPLWSTKSFWAYSKDVLGAVNMEGNALASPYMFMNAYKADGTPLRYGLPEAPISMNIIFSNDLESSVCLDKLNLWPNMYNSPYNLAIDQASFIRDWETGLWDNKGTNCTKVTKWLRDDAYFIEPVTGNQKANVNSSHYFFSIWYYYLLPSWWCPYYEGVHHIDIVDNFQIVIYFDSRSYWNTYYGNVPILPMDTWMQQPNLVKHETATFVEGINLTTPGWVDLDRVVWIESVTVDDTPLTMFTDYNIFASPDGLTILKNITDGAQVVVDYWSVGESLARGLTPGNVAWQTIFEGAGMYYATGFTPGMGGSLSLKPNPYYWMETPPLGEIDFAWKFEDGPKPRNGYYQIDIYDLASAGAAFGSKGTGVPSSNWFPGADIAPNGGFVDIYDVVTVTCNFGSKYAIP